MKIACVGLNYKSPKSILRLMHSLLNLDVSLLQQKPQVYLVDNGSQDDSVELIEKEIQSLAKKERSRVELLKIEKNRGYAGGMNFGIQTALNHGFEYIWCLTEDLTLEPTSLSALVQCWSSLERPGFLGALTDFNGTDSVYFFRAHIDKYGRIRHGVRGRKLSDIQEVQGREWGETDYVNGSCVFTHKSVLERVGLIPEEYGIYFEDAEWGLSSLRAGLKNYVSYKARVHHHRELSGRLNMRAEYHCRVNAYKFKVRNGFATRWTKPLELSRQSRKWLKVALKNRLGHATPESLEFEKVLKTVVQDLWRA